MKMTNLITVSTFYKKREDEEIIYLNIGDTYQIDNIILEVLGINHYYGIYGVELLIRKEKYEKNRSKD